MLINSEQYSIYKIIEDINKRNLSTIKNKCSPSYIVVSKEMYIYLKKNFNNKFNF